LPLLIGENISHIHVTKLLPVTTNLITFLWLIFNLLSRFLYKFDELLVCWVEPERVITFFESIYGWKYLKKHLKWILDMHTSNITSHLFVFQFWSKEHYYSLLLLSSMWKMSRIWFDCETPYSICMVGYLKQALELSSFL
jgi:hypothetical protein